MKFSLRDAPGALAIGLLHFSNLLHTDAENTALARRQAVTPAACRPICDPATEISNRVTKVCNASPGLPCFDLACTTSFLDGVDECTICLVQEGETSPSEAKGIAIQYTDIRRECISYGYRVSPVSTADTGVPKGGNTSNDGSTSLPDISDSGSKTVFGGPVFPTGTGNGNGGLGNVNDGNSNTNGNTNSNGSSGNGNDNVNPATTNTATGHATTGTNTNSNGNGNAPNSATKTGLSGTLVLVALLATML